MIQIYLRQLLILCKRLLICYLAYLVCRLFFFWANKSYFPATGFTALLKNCFYGLRFDSFSIVISNSLFILLSLLPVNAFFKSWYQSLLKWIFIITNSVFILANLVDAGYFPFIRKRSSYDLFKQIGGQTDLTKLLPQFARDFWWVILAYTLLIALLVFLYKRTRLNITGRYTLSNPKQWSAIICIFILLSGFGVLGARGGLQRVPIDIVNAGSVTAPDEVPIVLNTPFTLIKSVNQKALEAENYFPENKLKTLYDPVHYFKDSTFKKQNVVVLILESFSKEYTRLGRTKSLTPFLDSLMDHSLTFTDAFSNGTKSIEGIPSILSALPSFMENPFINSVYANNKQSSLASLLNKEGYETAFFHGGINGTMNFDDWAASAGYTHYFGKNEYKNDKDFDNFWGIWDEPFLQYSVKKMSEFKQPFHAAVFTLSSHHPYFVPQKYKSKFPKGELENAESIGYADYALKEFFTAAKKTIWYNNTLFILTADHASISKHPFFSNVVGNQSIPVLFFRPDNSMAGVNDHVFSQMDILPSALELLGYNKPFFSFGQPFVSHKDLPAYFYISGNYYAYSDSLVYFFNSNKLNAAFNYRRDSTLSNNILNQHPLTDSLIGLKIKAFIQTYNQTLISNSGKLQ